MQAITRLFIRVRDVNLNSAIKAYNDNQYLKKTRYFIIHADDKIKRMP